MIYMDRKTTTFIILLGLIIASSLFQGCVEGNTALNTLESQKARAKAELERLYGERNTATNIANVQCKDNECAIEKKIAEGRAEFYDPMITQTEKKIEDLEEAIKMLETVEAENKDLREQIEIQKKEIRDARNSAQGASIVLGKIQPDIVAQREVQNYTKQKLATAIKNINKLSG